MEISLRYVGTLGRRMDEQRKNAYRYLLYWAMLNLRMLAWSAPRWWQWFNPFVWRRQSRVLGYVGELADWMHNMASSASADFKGFNEAWFWEDLEVLQQRYPEFHPTRYRGRFDERIAEAAVSQPSGSAEQLK